MNLSFEKIVEKQIAEYNRKIEEINLEIDHCILRKYYWKHNMKPINKYFIKRYSERIQKLDGLVHGYENMVKFSQDALNGKCGRKIKALAENYQCHYLQYEALEHDLCDRIRALEQAIMDFREVYVDPSRIRKEQA